MTNRENNGFFCKNCGIEVFPLTNGSYRNHCPNCLYSLHVDNTPGDRLNICKGLMKPESYRLNSKKGFQIKHRCLICNKIQWNKIAENTLQPDKFIEWIQKYQV